MQPPKNDGPDAPEHDPKVIKTYLAIGSIITVIWLAIIGSETLQAVQKGAMAKAVFGGVLLLVETGMFSYLVYRASVHQEIVEEKWNRIVGWIITAGALLFLFAWKS